MRTATPMPSAGPHPAQHERGQLCLAQSGRGGPGSAAHAVVEPHLHAEAAHHGEHEGAGEHQVELAGAVRSDQARDHDPQQAAGDGGHELGGHGEGGARADGAARDACGLGHQGASSTRPPCDCSATMLATP